MTSKAWRERLKRLEEVRKEAERWLERWITPATRRLYEKQLQETDLEIQACITGLRIAKQKEQIKKKGIGNNQSAIKPVRIGKIL